MANYSLKTNKSTLPQIVYLRKSFNGVPFKYALGMDLKVVPSDWDIENQCYSSSVKNFKLKNNFLERLNFKFEALVDEIRSKSGYVDTEQLRKRLDEVIHRERKKTVNTVELDFYQIWELWLQELALSKSEGTCKKRRYTLNSLKRFSNDTGYKISMETINLEFLRIYKTWAFEQKKADGTELFTTDNGVNKYLSITMGFMNWATLNGYNQCLDYKKIKGITEEYFWTFALQRDELFRLNQLNFCELDESYYRANKTSVEKLITARDAFVFRSLCGIRFSDFEKITQSNFVGSTLQLVTRKTRTPLYMELPEIALNLAKKYNYNLPNLGNALENETLKLLGKLAEMNDTVEVPRKRKGKMIYDQVPKWQCLTTHVARKTFITSCLRAGMRPDIVMKIVGIKKESTFRRYVDIADFDIKNESAKVLQFFNEV